MSAIVRVQPAKIARQSQGAALHEIQKLNFVERTIAYFAPQIAFRRLQARTALALTLRHYDGASTGRRTSGWRKNATDANASTQGTLQTLRGVCRDLVRNSGWARKGVQVIGNNVVGWGIQPRFKSKEVTAIWKKWAGTTKCHLRGRKTFYGLQRLAIDTVVQSGECLVIRHRTDAQIRGHRFPLQLDVLEADYIDSNKEMFRGQSKDGNVIIQGVEIDSKGRRVAYWLHDAHPGSNLLSGYTSRRVDAKDVLHIMREDRPGQLRGIPWFAPVVVKLHDFDDYEDAVLMRQKIAACFTAFVTNMEGTAQKIGPDGTVETSDAIDGLEPGMVHYLNDGESVEFASPPTVTDNDSFARTTQRGIAAGIGVTYEDLTGDYSNVNFSSARMSRLAHQGNVHDWRWNMLIPLMCDPSIDWFMEAATFAGLVPQDFDDTVLWTPPPMPMIDPEKEGLAFKRNLRSGLITFDEMILGQGNDPEEHWDTYASGLAELDRRKITLDSDARRTSEQGQAQETNAAQPAKKKSSKAPET